MVAPAIVAKAVQIGGKALKGMKAAGKVMQTAEGVEKASNIAKVASSASQTVDSAMHIKDSIFGKKQANIVDPQQQQRQAEINRRFNVCC